MGSSTTVNPNNGGSQVGTLKWWRQSHFALKKLSSKLCDLLTPCFLRCLFYAGMLIFFQCGQKEPEWVKLVTMLRPQLKQGLITRWTSCWGLVLCFQAGGVTFSSYHQLDCVYEVEWHSVCCQSCVVLVALFVDFGQHFIKILGGSTPCSGHLGVSYGVHLDLSS